MRVLVLCEYESLNGGERSFLEAARRLPASEFQMAVAAPPTGPLAEALERYGLGHIPLRMFDDNATRLSQGRLRQRIAACIAASNADLVHANSLSMSRLSGPVTEQLKIPSLGHLRDIIRLSRASIADLNRHDCLLAVSQATRQWYLEAGLSAAKTKVAYNGVDLERFRPRPNQTALHQELRIPSESPIVGSIGQLGMRKGVDLFADAALRIASSHSDVHFVFVGRRYSTKQEAMTFEENVRRVATADTLRGRFHFLGLRDDVDLILSEIAIYVHAARQEPLGRVLLEAGATGTAVVATDVGGTKEIFPPQSGSAILVAPHSATDLAKAVEHLLSDFAARRSMGAAARLRVAEAFGVQLAATELGEWYRKVAAG